MDAWVSYRFGFVLPEETVGLYIHGYDVEKFLVLDLSVRRSPSRPGAFNPSASLHVEAVGEHVDNTKVCWLSVTNRSTSTGAEPAPVVSLLALEAELT
jgi:hypothetical protein